MRSLKNTVFRQLNRLRKIAALPVLLGSFLVSSLSYAQTVVNVETVLGNFSIELFDSAAPATVANFLNYVSSGRYNGTVVHRSEANFVIQGGGFGFDAATQTFPAINTDPAVVNEFGISNTRGTLAMAKVAGDINSATSQWFVNLRDNSAGLDNAEGGYTVFGRIIEPGMTIIDIISNLNTIDGGGAALGKVPVVGVTNEQGVVESIIVVQVQMSVSTPPEPVISNSFDEATGRLNLKVAIDGNQFLRLSFVVESTVPQVVIRALVDSIVPESTGDASFATFSSADGSLLIPQLYINGAVAFRNVRFTLTDGAEFLFTLQSTD